MKYLCDPQIVPAVMPNSLVHLQELAEEVREYASWLHIDVMDGEFAPNPAWRDFDALKDARLPTNISIEMHLMTAHPHELGQLCAAAGAKRIIAHIEAFAEASDALVALHSWKAAGAGEAGIAIKIDTPLSAIDAVARECDFLQLMSIEEIGFQGKPFDERAISRVEELHAMYPDMMVGVDGGVSESNVEELVRAGANRLVVGGALVKSDDPARTYAQIHERAMRGCAPRSAVETV